MSSKTELRTSPVDGGWGWIVVFSSFMLHAIADGVIFSFGVLHHEWVQHFQATEASTSLISSLLVGFTLCMGPVSSALVNKYGSRAVAVGGGTLGAIGIIMSAFADSIFKLQLTIGIIAGTGLGLIYLPATVSVMSYFERKRSLATGISVCGSGVGTFIMAPIRHYLVQAYGWRGTMLISGGIMLNCIPCGLLFKPLATKYNKVTEPGFLSKFYIKSENENLAIKTRGSSENIVIEAGDNLKVELIGLNEKTESHSASLEVNIQTAQTALSARREESLKISKGQAEKETIIQKSIIGEVLDISLFKNPTFIILSVSNFSASLGFNVPYIYIISLAQQVGIPETQGSFILSVIGIANTSGRIILGYIFDQKWANKQKIYSLCLVVGGLGAILIVVCKNTIQFLLCATIFGLTMGAYSGLTSIIVVDTLGLEKLGNVFGWLLLFQGIANLMGPPITGLVYDWKKSYSLGFVIAGSIISSSGLLLLFLLSKPK